MKKKRSGKKKSNTQNNKPNNSGTTAKVTIEPDKHHNWSRPCSALAHAILQETLPALPSSNGVVKCCGGDSAVSSSECLCFYCQLAVDKDASGKELTTGKLLFTQQPLLAFMILRHMLEERKKIRAAEQKGIVGDQELDNLLDSYIDCTETSNIIDNEAKKWGSRDLDSFVAYLAQNYDCQKKINKQNPLKLKDILPTISIESINSVLESVKCRSCRFSANSHLQSLLGVEKSRDNDTTKSKGATTIILSDQAMDTVDSESFYLELQPITQTSDDVKYLQIEATSKEHGSSALSYPLSTQDIINLTRFIILPKNMNTGDKIDSNNNPVGDDELTEIAKEAFTTVRDFETRYEVAGSMYNSIVSVLKKITKVCEREYEDDDESVQVTRKMLLECNVNCDIVMKKIGDLLLLLFKKITFVGWSETWGETLMSFFHSVWDEYNTTSDSLLQPTSFHRNGMSGVFLKTSYFHRYDHGSAMRKERDSLQELVTSKTSAISKMLKSLTAYINGSAADDDPSPLVILCVMEAYRTKIEHLESADVMNREEEGLFMQLISARINLSQVTTSNKDTGGVQCMSEKYSKEVETLCKKIKRIISTMGPDVASAGIEFLDKAYRENELSYDKIQTVIDHVSAQATWTGRLEDFEKVKKDAEVVCNMSILLEKSFWDVMQWLTVLCSRQCKESATKSITLPPRLETWLDTTSGNNASQADNIKLTCSGVGGENRVSSIISGLIYRWLEAQCSEWQAELATDELLHSMEEPALTASPRKGGRKSKKKKAAANSIKANVSSANRGDVAEEIVLSDVPETVQQKAESKGDASSSIDDDQQKNHTISPDEDEDEKIFNGEYDTTTSSNDEQITSTPKTMDQLVVPNSSSDNKAEEKKYEDVNLYENSDHQVGQPQSTEDEGYVKDRTDNLDQNVFTPTGDSLCTDPSVVDSSSTSSHNHMHEQVDTQEDTLD